MGSVHREDGNDSGVKRNLPDNPGERLLLAFKGSAEGIRRSGEILQLGALSTEHVLPAPPVAFLFSAEELGLCWFHGLQVVSVEPACSSC